MYKANLLKHHPINAFLVQLIKQVTGVCQPTYCLILEILQELLRHRALKIIAIALIGWAANVHAETVTIFGSDAYIPYSYLEGEHVRGIFPALLGRLEAETGDHYQVKLLPWNRALTSMQSGLGGIMALSWTIERAETIDYSVPLYDDETVLVVLKGHEFDFVKIEDLRGKTLGIGNGSSYGEVVDKAINTKLFNIDRDNAPATRLNKLFAGRFDAAIMGTGRIGVKMLIDTDKNLQSHADQFIILPNPITKNPLSIGFSKFMGTSDVINRLNSAYRKLRKEGKLKDILGY